MKFSTTMMLACALLVGCGSDRGTEDQAPAQTVSWTIAEAEVFPAERTLSRPEDGVILPDGRLIVGDQRHGLIELKPDGSYSPFGNFDAAGYSSEPGPDQGAPNGVHLSHDGKHILVADVHTGKIYRTKIESETTDVVLSHTAVVNTAIEDSTGAIWFTQSTAGFGDEKLFAAVDKPAGDGALFRLVREGGGTFAQEPEMLVDGLDFANGFYLDEAGGKLYLSETAANRVLAFSADFEAGVLGERTVLAEIPTPDNMRMTDDGSLWIASPLSSKVFAVDPANGGQRTVFDAQSEEGAEVLAEWMRRGEAGESRLDLLGSDAWDEMPGLLTGIIVDQDDRPIFISGLGDALVRLDR